MPATEKSSFRWWILALMVITGTFVAAMPQSSLPALFKEIADDLNLSLVQIGSVWGFTSLAGIFVSLLGGVIADRFGTRRVLVVLCLLTGLTGALRGVSSSFMSLGITVILNGLVRLIVPVVITKAIGLWFRGPRLGLAMGLGAMGMGLGLTLGPLLSGTVLSPWLGGWRGVMYLLGGLSVFIGLLWWLFGREPVRADSREAALPRVPFRRAIGELIRVRAIWILGLSLMFRMGSQMGMIGYLPTYLKNAGWDPAAADGTLSTFFAISTICVVPIAYLSDRLHSRLKIMLPAVVTCFLGLVLLPTANGALVWVLMIISGMFLDGYMSLTTTSLMEARGIRPEYSGVALGMVFTIAQVGAVTSPPLGNALADIAPGAPFYLWAGLAAIGFFVLLMHREQRPASVEVAG